jgi:hypothetical protein
MAASGVVLLTNSSAKSYLPKKCRKKGDGGPVKMVGYGGMVPSESEDFSCKNPNRAKCLGLNQKKMQQNIVI